MNFAGMEDTAGASAAEYATVLRKSTSQYEEGQKQNVDDASHSNLWLHEEIKE